MNTLQPLLPPPDDPRRATPIPGLHTYPHHTHSTTLSGKRPWKTALGDSDASLQWIQCHHHGQRLSQDRQSHAFHTLPPPTQRSRTTATHWELTHSPISRPSPSVPYRTSIESGSSGPGITPWATVGLTSKGRLLHPSWCPWILSLLCHIIHSLPCVYCHMPMLVRGMKQVLLPADCTLSLSMSSYNLYITLVAMS